MTPPRRQTRTLLTAGILGMLASAHVLAAEEPLGRLFFTPEKRQMLDRQRTLNTLELSPVVEEQRIQINGQVRRSSGKRTTWINGQAQNDGEIRTGVLVLPDAQGAERVTIETGDIPKASVKVGETLDRGSQETASPLGDGKIIVHRGGKPPLR